MAVLFAAAVTPVVLAHHNADESPNETVTIGVFGLFHPRELDVSAPGISALILRADEQSIVLERSSGISTAHIRLSGRQLTVSVETRSVKADRVTIASRLNEPAVFDLAVPGRITRHYRGTIEVRAVGPELVPAVTMDREIAVASIVAAESSPDAPLEALKAQAIATRSYLVAGAGRHRGYDFCDTTHCQFLREAPRPKSNVSMAVEATRGQVLTYQAHVFAPMYTRSCSGRTHTPAERGLSSGPYPYYEVECRYCQSYPARWSSRISGRDATELRATDENARLRLVRRRGWSTVPSDDFTVKVEGEHVLLEGVGRGHGIGLCQAGAKAMAEAGADFREILAHYYPNTAIASTSVPSQSH